MKFAMLVGLVLLSGCFLDQKAPQTGEPAPTQASTLGVVLIEDLSGLDLSETSLRGTFVESGNRFSAQLGDGNRGCKVTRGATARQVASRAQAYKEVGKLYFGPVLQSTLTEIPIQEDKRYFLPLAQGFPSGLYVVAARKQNVANFEGYLSLPESLGGVQANGSDFATDGVLYQRSQDLTVSWNAPAVASDKSLIIVDMVADGAEGSVSVRCMGAEPTDGGGVFEWKLPQAEVSQLPDADRGLIFVSRVHVNDVVENGWDVQLQGMRTRVTVMRVQP